MSPCPGWGKSTCPAPLYSTWGSLHWWSAPACSSWSPWRTSRCGVTGWKSIGNKPNNRSLFHGNNPSPGHRGDGGLGSLAVTQAEKLPADHRPVAAVLRGQPFYLFDGPPDRGSAALDPGRDGGSCPIRGSRASGP